MAVVFRTSVSSTSPSSSRDVSANIVTQADDFLVIFHFKMDNTSDDIIYEYDGGGTNLTKVGEFSRGIDGEIVLYHFDPSANLGQKTVHIKTNNGQDQQLLIMVYTGVNFNAPVNATESNGMHYQNEQDIVSLASVNNGMLISGWSSAGAGYVTMTGGDTSRFDSTSGNRQQVWEEAATGTPTAMTFDSDGADSNKSSWSITLDAPQNVSVTPTRAEVVASAHLGSVDDGNITLSAISPAEAVTSAVIGGIQIMEPIEADMGLFT